MLAVGRGFNTRRRCGGRRTYVRIVLRGGILPVIGRGSAMYVARLVFASGSRLSNLVTGVVGTSALVLLDGISNVCGNSPDRPAAHVVPSICCSHSVDRCVLTDGDDRNENNVASGMGATRSMTGTNVGMVVTGNGAPGVLVGLGRRPVRALRARFITEPLGGWGR